MKVTTPKGVIEATQGSDPDYPSMVISINGQDLVFVEYDPTVKCHRAHVWNKKDDEAFEAPTATVNLDKE